MRNINEITIEDVIETYAGKPGCGCGCRGTYSSEHSVSASRLAEMQVAETINPGSVQMDDDDGIVIYALETDAKFIWIYVKPVFNAALEQEIQVHVDFCADCGDGAICAAGCEIIDKYFR
jgi:hypothetical protein